MDGNIYRYSTTHESKSHTVSHRNMIPEIKSRRELKKKFEFVLAGVGQAGVIEKCPIMLFLFFSEMD